MKGIEVNPETLEIFKKETRKEAAKRISAEITLRDNPELHPFLSKDLLDRIKNELSKSHLEDDNLKMTAFLVAISGLLKDSRKRMSMALTGDSSVGKDNLMKTILKHMPGEKLFLTGATQPAIEDAAVFVKILALSEMNLFREGGANRNLLEVVKQRTEGGTSSLKKDLLTGFKTTKHEETEQGTVFYGTTDAERNAETETRFIFGNIGAGENKIRKVNFHSAKKVADIDELTSSNEEEDSWIKEGLSNLSERYGDCLIWIPYAELLIEKNVIDNQNPRSMRDFKRLLALTSAMTFIFALQRKGQRYKDSNVLISEPQDLFNTIKYSKEFFNQTYSGMDERLNGVLKVIDSSVSEWVARDYIQRKVKVSLNTIKGWIDTLERMGLVEWKKGVDLNFQSEEKIYDGNKIYFKRCQKGVKIPLIRCQEDGLKEIFKDYKLTPFTHKRYQNKGVNLEKSELNNPKKSKIDTFSLTPFEDLGVKGILENEKK